MKLAAPSFVFPGTVAENARFLAGKVAEVGLCCFETAASLAYTDVDLPPDLAHLPLRWHLHLPVDLPWAEGGEAAAEAALAVLGKVRYLEPHLAVLHPPGELLAKETMEQALAVFAQRWNESRGPGLLLENICGFQLAELGADFLDRHSLGVCLDVGHLLGYAQAELLASDLPERARLLHWSAPGPNQGQDRHLPLDALTREQQEVVKALWPRISPKAVHLLEVFHWEGVTASRRWLENLASGESR